MKCQTCGKGWPVKVEAYEGPAGFTLLCDPCLFAGIDPWEPQAPSPEAKYVANVRPY